MRRLAADEHFVRDVVMNEEYAAAGYEITARDLVVDIGGNIGSFTLYAAAKAHGGQVVSVEPIQDNYRLLVQNIKMNGFANVLAKQAALVPRRKTVRVYFGTLGFGSHSILPVLAQQSQRFEDVEGITLANLFEEYQLPHCDFLKMDCEGAEFGILREMDLDLSRRISKLVVEYHTLPDRDKHEQAHELIDRLVELGFTIDRYTDVVGTNWGTIFARRLSTRSARKRRGD